MAEDAYALLETVLGNLSQSEKVSDETITQVVVYINSCQPYDPYHPSTGDGKNNLGRLLFNDLGPDEENYQQVKQNWKNIFSLIAKITSSDVDPVCDALKAKLNEYKLGPVVAHVTDTALSLAHDNSNTKATCFLEEFQETTSSGLLFSESKSQGG